MDAIESTAVAEHAAASGIRLVTGDTWRSRSGRFTRTDPADFARRLRALESAPVFAAAPEDRLRLLARRLRRLEVPQGVRVVNQGETTDTVYIVERGSCRLAVEPKSGSAVGVGLLGPGDIFGEQSVTDDPVSPVSALAATDLRLLALDRAALFAQAGANSELIEALTQLATQRAETWADAAERDHRRAQDPATVIAVYSPKGGVGRTTVALNVAALLAAQNPHEVLLLDLSFPFNHCALLAGLVPSGSLARVGADTSGAFESRVMTAVVEHASGLRVLPAAIRNEEVEKVNSDLVRSALDVLGPLHRQIVVDLGPALTETALTVLDRAHEILLVTGADLASAKSVADTLEIFAELGIAIDRLRLVVNQRVQSPPLNPETLARILRREPDAELRYEGNRLDEHLLKGRIPVLAEPRSELARELRALVGAYIR